MLRKNLLLMVAILLMAGIANVSAQAPNTITYQGRLADSNGDPVTTATSVVFSIYAAASGGGALWTETKSVTPDANGVFTIELGATTALNTTVLNGSKRYLGIRVGADAEMTPRQLLTSAPYSFSTQNIPDNSVTSAKIASLAVAGGDIADNAITTIKIATGGVTTTDIASGAVTNSDLADNAVNSIKVADNSLTAADLAAGSVTASELATSSVTSTDILNGTIAAADLSTSVQQLLPIAFAFINSNGSKNAGTANVTSTWNATYARYEITISGESYYYNDYITVVTAANGVFFGRTGSASGNLLVWFYNSDGNGIQATGGFQFVTYKP